jgi:signal transduction histidine kinase
MPSESPPDEHTEVVQGREAVSRAIVSFFKNAKTRMDISTTDVRPDQAEWSKALADAYLEIGNRGGRLRMVTTIGSHNSRQCKEIAKAVELRHLGGIRGSFGVSDGEYMTSTAEPEPLSQLIYSNSRAFVKHHQAMFEMMWENGVPAEQKIEEIEMGVPPSETKVVREASEAAGLARGLIESSVSEVLIVLASPEVVSRNSADFRFLVKKSKERGFKIRMLAPIGELAAIKQLEGIEWRPIAGINAGIAIYDANAALLTQYSKTESDGAGQVVSNIFTTNRQFVRGLISIFEAMWNESELRQAERRSRKMAEVAQDILAHDIRNYNQIAMLNAESLVARVKDTESKKLVGTVLDAIKGSTNLIDKTRELGRILSQKDVKLFHVGVDESFRRALSLIREANPDRELDVASSIPAAKVLADDLLDEVFVNILSNAVRYTDGRRVSLEVSLEEQREAEPATPTKYWKLTVADHGKGMADELKREGFVRYSPSKKGSGLGLSIVRALVVSRYSGVLRFRDRVEDDMTKGTAVEVWLPKAETRAPPARPHERPKR